jgi:hypothetical protein
MTSEKSSRRWFSFSLRTLFVVLTAFGVWLGWHLANAQMKLPRHCFRFFGCFGCISFHSLRSCQWIPRSVSHITICNR